MAAVAANAERRGWGGCGERHPGQTRVEQLAAFVTAARFEDISEPAREQLKLRVLDAFGCALGALDAAPVRMVGEQVREFGGAPLATLIVLSRRFPHELSARVRLRLRDGRTLCREQHDYEGFHTRPVDWDAVAAKFDRLASRRVDDGPRERTKDMVARLDAIMVDELADELTSIPSSDKESR